MYNSTAMVHAQMPIYAMVPCNYYIHYFGIHMVLQKINLAQKSTGTMMLSYYFTCYGSRIIYTFCGSVSILFSVFILKL